MERKARQKADAKISGLLERAGVYFSPSSGAEQRSADSMDRLFIVSRGARLKRTSNAKVLFSSFFHSVRAVNREARREPSQPTHKVH